MTSPAGGTAQSGDAGGEAQGEAQSGPDLNALAGQFEQLSQGQEEMRQFLAQQFQQQETAQEPQQDEGVDLSFLDDAYGVDQETATQLADVIEKQMQAREKQIRSEMEQKINSVNERVSERERMEQMGDLVAEFPDMAQPEIAKQIVEQAHEITQAHGWDQNLSADPRFWRIVYAAQQSFQQAEQEGRDAPAAAHLEGGAGGAGASMQRGVTNDIEQALIDQSGGGRSVLPFP